MAAATFNFELVTPERLLISGEAEAVRVPGMEGEFTVMSGHVPFISTLRPGIIEVAMEGAKKRVFVSKGVAEADPERLTILAPIAVPVEELDGRAIEARIVAAETERAEAKDDEARHMADTLLDVLKRLQLAA